MLDLAIEYIKDLQKQVEVCYNKPTSLTPMSGQAHTKIKSFSFKQKQKNRLPFSENTKTTQHMHHIISIFTHIEVLILCICLCTLWLDSFRKSREVYVFKQSAAAAAAAAITEKEGDSRVVPCTYSLVIIWSGNRFSFPIIM